MKYFSSNECEEGAVSVGGFCEHCGDLPFDFFSISNGGTWYCEDCHTCVLSEEEQTEWYLFKNHEFRLRHVTVVDIRKQIRDLEELLAKYS